MKALATLLAALGLTTALLAVGLLSPASAQVAERATGDGHNAYKLAAHKDTVTYDADERMWDCWSPGVTPSFYAWTGKSWSRWAVAEMSSDKKKCGKDSSKAVFDFHVSLKGNKVAGKPYRLLKVKETCKGCEASVWKLPIIVN